MQIMTYLLGSVFDGMSLYDFNVWLWRLYRDGKRKSQL